MIVPGYYPVAETVHERWQRAEAERRKQRDVRMQNLRREIDRAKRGLREYDRFLAELRGLQREKRLEKKNRQQT